MRPASRRIARLVAAGVVATLAPLAAQDEGPVPARGRVLDLDRRPLAGAAISLRDGEGVEVTAATDHAGRWTALLPAEGRWEIVIRATGFVAGEGWLQVRRTPPAPEVVVRLRSLDEVLALAPESDPARTAREWLERANALLEQGRTAAARELYERAVPLLAAAERAAALRAVARADFLEGEVEAAVTSLKRALAADPGDADTRQLFAALLAELGRAAEAEATLSALDRDGVAALGLPASPPAAEAAPAPRSPALPIEPPVAGRRGRYRTAFAEGHPLAAAAVLYPRFGVTADQVASAAPAGRYELARESFHVVVPESYDPAAGWGLLVWISPGSSGDLVRPEIGELLATHRLVWAGADGAGNDRQRWDRAGLALDAVHNLTRLYDLDARRIFVAGYSGGGRLATSLGLLYPEVFRGVLALFGADFYRELPVPDRPGARWPPRLPEPGAAAVAAARRHPFVLVTGELDFNRPQTQEVHRAMLDDGFAAATLLEVPGASHYTPVPRDWLGRAFAALAAEPAAEPPADQEERESAAPAGARVSRARSSEASSQPPGNSTSR